MSDPLHFVVDGDAVDNVTISPETAGDAPNQIVPLNDLLDAVASDSVDIPASRALVLVPNSSLGSAVVLMPDRGGMQRKRREIELKLKGSRMVHLELCEHISRWVEITKQLEVVVQPERKPNGGRAFGGVAEAARRLALPGNRSDEGKRQLVRRAIRIAKIHPKAKQAAIDEQLDDNQAALLAIAEEEIEVAQVEIARKWKFGLDEKRKLKCSNPQQYLLIGVDGLDASARAEFDKNIDALCTAARVTVVRPAVVAPTPPDEARCDA